MAPAEDDANADDALVQFELYEVLVRLAFAKFINSKEMSDASDALDRLMEEHVLPNIPEEVLVDPNEFRFNRMYTEDVEEVLLKYDDFLIAIFQVWRVCMCQFDHTVWTSPGKHRTLQVYKAADKTKFLWIEHYKEFLDVCFLLKDHEFGMCEHDARFMFYWSQSVVRDELRNRQRAVSLIYPDFVEVLLPSLLGCPPQCRYEHQPVRTVLLVLNLIPENCHTAGTRACTSRALRMHELSAQFSPLAACFRK